MTNAVLNSWLPAVRFLSLSLLILVPLAYPADFIRRNGNNSFDAEIDQSNLEQVLTRLATETSWLIYVEPESDRHISVKFKELHAGEALRRLLGDLNFALLPQSEGPPKLFVYRTSVQEATQLVAPPPSPVPPSAPTSKRIPNELIVTLKPGKGSIDELARRLGAKVVGSAEELNSYRLQFNDEASADSAKELLAMDPDVAQTDANFSIAPPAQMQRLQYGSPPPFNLRPKVTTDTTRVVIGLIDTPVQPLVPNMNQFLLPPVHVAGEAAPPTDRPSHGTSMAETILQGLALASPEETGSPVRLLPVDVYGPNPQTTTFDVAKGIYAAIEGGATLINLSMGSDGDSKFLSNLIRDSHKQGVLFFGAAGNEPLTLPTYPAAYSEVVAVTAGDRKGNLAPYANRGSFVDVIAPGMSIVQFQGQSFLVSGTSPATAYVSGTAAGIRATGKNAAQTESLIREQLAVRPPKKK